jgi:hypothetical protein
VPLALDAYGKTQKPRSSLSGAFLDLPGLMTGDPIDVDYPVSWGFSKMDQRTPSEMLAFAPRPKARDGADPIDQAGHGLVAMLQEAAKISNENVERAMSMAHKLSIQLRAAEDRIAQLEGQVTQLQGEVEGFRNRATRAEDWLGLIKQEIEEKLIAPMEANRREPPAVH